MHLFALALVLLANIKPIGIEIVGKKCSSLFASSGSEVSASVCVVLFVIVLVLLANIRPVGNVVSGNGITRNKGYSLFVSSSSED
jgi:hypothetical protein